MSDKKAVKSVSLEDESSELDLVQLDGLVVLKIIKHCQEMLPDLVTGQLLGLDISSTVEVTNCFPFPAKVAEENEEDIEAEAQVSQEYQIEMMRCLREVNVDDNTVGWYSSTYMESFFNESTIETQYTYQERIKKSVMIIYDPLKTAQGFLSLRAYRLTQPFMTLFAEGTFTKDSLSKVGLSFSDVFEEIPIKITNSNLIKAFLLELEESGRVESDFERLDLSTNPMLEKNLETICDCLDDLAQEQNKFQYYQRNLQKQLTQRTAWLQKRRTENAQRKASGQDLLPEEDPTNPIFKPIPEPSRLDSLLLTNQVNNYCREMNRFSSNSLTKLFLTTHLNNPQ